MEDPEKPKIKTTTLLGLELPDVTWLEIILAIKEMKRGETDQTQLWVKGKRIIVKQVRFKAN